jgi:hypothetical protein
MRFAIRERSQFFIMARNETLSVAVRVDNLNCSTFTIHG